MVVAGDIGEQTRTSSSKNPDGTNKLSENPKKPKMKLKAAKVFKFLFNLLQIKPKRKHGDPSKLCFHSHAQDSCLNENNIADCEIHPLITRPVENAPALEQTNNGLSMSWSYLVHDPFVSSLEQCGPADDSDHGGIFYNESYFEDDYWEDYCEHDNLPFKSPVLCGNQIPITCSYRLFEPERTPCGEFKRKIIVDAPRRRHASLPNFTVEDEHSFKELPTNNVEVDIGEVSELMDYNQLVSSHPHLGLNIAFDLLDETNSYNSKICSANPEQLTSTDETCTEQFIEYDTDNNLTICEEQENISGESFQWSIDLEHSCSFNSQLSYNITPEIFETAEDSSIHVIEIFSESQVSNTSMENSVTEESSDNTLAKRTNSDFDYNSLDMSISSLHKSEYKSLPSERPVTMEVLSKQSLESGYCSTDNSSPTSVGLTPDLQQAAIFSLNTDTATSLDLCTEARMLDTKQVFTGKEVKDIQNSPSTFPVKTLTKSAEIKGITIPSTSSPVHVLNSSLLSRRVLTAIPDFLSPIRQNSEISISPRISPLGCDESLKQCRQGKKDFRVDSSFHQRHNLRNVSCEVTVPDPFSEDYDLLTATADFILNRIVHKENLKCYINRSELVEYLNSFYMAEVCKLLSKHVQTVADYRNITKEGVDTFTSNRLTHINCFSELLIAILTNRPRVVSACEVFIFKNLHYFIDSEDYLNAAPELILMLLCDCCRTVLDSQGHDNTIPLGNRSELEIKIVEIKIKRAIKKYLDAYKIKNVEKYLQVQRMFSSVFDRVGTVNLSLSCSVAAKNFSMTSIHAKVANPETEMNIAVKYVNAESVKTVHVGVDSGHHSAAKTNEVKHASGVKISSVHRRPRSSYSVGKSRFVLKLQHPKPLTNWNSLGPAISTIV